jgi:hypothetical protein
VRRAFAAGLVLAVALALPAVADAKSCVRMSISPQRPMVGQLVTLRLTVWLPTWEAGKPRLVERMELAPDSVLRSRIGSLRGAPSFRVRYRRDPQRPWLWRARFHFPSGGRWTVDPPDAWYGAPPACAPKLRVRVR